MKNGTRFNSNISNFVTIFFLKCQDFFFLKPILSGYE